MLAYFAAGIFGLAISIGLWLWQRGAGMPWNPTQSGALLASILLLAAAIVWCVKGRDSFEKYAHYTAAIPLFVLIVIIVVQNARAQSDKRDQRQRTRYTRLYRAIALLMSLSLVFGFVGWLLTGELFVTEAVLLALFLVFWLVQTVELWDKGIRAAT